jgi:thioredoxin-related protein
LNLPKALAVAAMIVLNLQQPVRADHQVFDKPLFLMVFDKTCHAWCNKVRPIVKELRDQYGEKMDFCELDITQEKLPETKKEASQLGVLPLLPDFGDQVPCCAVCAKKRTNIIKEISGPKEKVKYEEMIELALSHK